LTFTSNSSETEFNDKAFAARLLSTNAALTRANELKRNGGVTREDWDSFMTTICPQLETAAFLRTSTLDVYLSEFERLCEGY
jgi:hypothetical protein